MNDLLKITSEMVSNINNTSNFTNVQNPTVFKSPSQEQEDKLNEIHQQFLKSQTWGNNLTQEVAAEVSSSHQLRHKRSKSRKKRSIIPPDLDLVHGGNEIKDWTNFAPSFLTKAAGTIYVTFTPEFFEETFFNWVNNNNRLREETDFGIKVYNSLTKIFDFSKHDGDNVKYISPNTFNRIISILHSMFRNRIKIADFWDLSDKEHRILLKFKLITKDGVFEAINYEAKYLGSEIITSYTIKYPNKYLENLKRDLNITDKTETNLGIIAHNDHYWNSKVDSMFGRHLSMKIMAQKYPHMLNWEDEMNSEIIDVAELQDYSHFCQCFSLKIVIRYKSVVYSHGILNHKFLYITKDKIIELNNIIANDPKTQEWLTHIKDWYSTLAEALEHAKTLSPLALKDWKRTQKEIMKSYIRDWSYISTLIEHEWKLDELNKNAQGLKSDFETMKKEVNELQQKVMNLENISNWNCANIPTITAGYYAPVPIIGTAVSAIATVTAGACAIAGV